MLDSDYKELALTYGYEFGEAFCFDSLENLKQFVAECERRHREEKEQE